MRKISAILTMASLASALWGCSQAAKLGACPEVRVTCRNALLDKSKVVNVTNSGSKPLFNVCIWAQGWDSRFRIANQLDVGASVTIGWMELPRGFKPGETIYISADGYPANYVIDLPDEGPAKRS